MKQTKIKFILLGLSVLIGLSVVPDSILAYDSVITGKNNAEQDVQAVQEAVDKGGKVLLKGTFNFGKKDRVNIKNDIEIIGEADSEGKPLTKIMGGFWSFHSPLPTTELPMPGPGPKIKINHIHFNGATWAPMHFPYTSGAEITGNIITNVQPYEIKRKWKGGDTIWFQHGAIFGTRFAHKDKFLPGATTGNLIFKNNIVNLKCKNPEITMAQGAFFLWTWGADIHVIENTFRNVSRNSIETLDNYLNEEGEGRITISKNNVVLPTKGCAFPGPSSFPNGIIVGWYLDRTGGTDPTKTSKAIVDRNFVQVNGELATGIISLADGTVIVGNRVQVKGGPKSRAITQLYSNGFIARNKIDGSGRWAIGALSFKNFKANSNTIAWNDLKEFKAADADFLCSGNKNTFMGAKCKVVDKGKENLLFVKN